jgi:ribosomal protein S18 acetylase RimI-like enzyme
MAEQRERRTEVHVQKATVEDVKAIQQLCFGLMQHVKQWSRTLDENWILSVDGEAYLKSCVTQAGSTVLKATVDDTIAGFVIGSAVQKPYRLERKFAEIDFFFVAPQSRGQGVGTELMKGFEKWCKSQDVQVIRVETAYSNVDAQAFYRRRKFHNYEVVLERKIIRD